MKLLQYTTRYFLLFTLIALPVGIGLLYLTLKVVLQQEQDEMLMDTANRLVRQWSETELPKDNYFLMSDNWIEIQATATGKAAIWKDTVIWNSTEQELEPARKYIFTAYLQGKPYRVALTHSVVDSEELLLTALISIGGLLVLLLLAIYFFNHYFVQQLWKSFQETLTVLAGFNFAGEKPLELPDTRVEEFTALNRTVNTMSERMVDDYLAMRQFSGNAAHELQTPIAIVQSKAELLLQSPHLNEKEIGYVADILQTTHRLTRLNKALLFLNRIESRQFQTVETISMKSVIEEKLQQLSEHIEVNGIQVIKDLKEVFLEMNPALADALVGNLLNNAIRHNLPRNGEIEIQLDPDRLRVRNTGLPLSVPPEAMFDRFRKGNDGGKSTGLGLAMVREIGRLYHFSITYRQEGKWHDIEVFF